MATSRLQKEVALALSASGLLGQGIPGFRPRGIQQSLAQAIVEAAEGHQTLVAEAGTGIGKTFAYLVPALLSGKRTLVSTGSKNLQDQLFFKDLPALLKLMERPPKVALLKGRSNYLCHYHLNRRLTDLPDDPTLVDQLMRIRHWANGTPSGDFAELTSVPEGSLALTLAGSSNDNCLGRKCPEFERCCLKKARDKAMEADLVVVNHHLFFADMALKETGFGEILPTSELFVFDEAHQLPDIALTHFATSLSSRQLNDLAREMERAYAGPLRDCRQLHSGAQRLKAATVDLYDALGGESTGRGNLDWRALRTQSAVEQALSSLTEGLDFARRVLEGQLSRDEGADHAFERAALLQTRLSTFLIPAGHSLTVECQRGHFVLRASPLSVAEQCQAYYAQFQAGWVFTSATLTVADRFDHFIREMGLSSPKELILDSPFDYPKQALLCVPRYLPEPGQANLSQALAEVAEQLVKAADGRTFLLFTSYQMMHQVGEILARRLSQPLLVQGMGSKRTLLSRFTQLGNAVLLATASFWEGVDVRGKALCCVMIDKLPFASPDDPLVKARSDAVLLRGGDPFNEVQLPQAVIALKQGVGRLIRGEGDRGILVIADPRLVARPYGGLFLASLPPMSRTRDLNAAVERLRTL
ncbi:ATP-dependent DNA helicase [Ferrimonas balearica]|uniref:ATP-dependent DNA helicase n=1 Tax=Ferrimonas balearica TaxID=44012 RepID=UPI001C98EED3|nr:ATP-dependent DNA helicase [Ferrimonas balearica]MBY5991409.1 ATP-dependent DNA helicase [Ferrimonas balearica]